MQVDLVGYLTWHAKERRMDRYGGIGLQEHNANVNEGENSPPIDLSPAAPLVGKQIRLIATVLESHESCHIGDLYHGFRPSKTDVGTELDLGTGQFVDIEKFDDMEQIVFRRNDSEPETDFWIDPRLLYKLHDHKVKLSLVEVA